jgi:hypothetical protein
MHSQDTALHADSPASERRLAVTMIEAVIAIGWTLTATLWLFAIGGLVALFTL